MVLRWGSVYNYAAHSPLTLKLYRVRDDTLNKLCTIKHFTGFVFTEHFPYIIHDRKTLLGKHFDFCQSSNTVSVSICSGEEWLIDVNTVHSLNICSVLSSFIY